MKPGIIQSSPMATKQNKTKIKNKKRPHIAIRLSIRQKKSNEN